MQGAPLLATLIDELGQVLEDERRTLLAGNPDSIHALIRRKLSLAELIETACSVPGTAPPNFAQLTRLARYNQENSVICAAMLRHMNDAVDRLREHNLHRSYNSDGTEQRPSAKHSLGAA